MEMTQYFTSAHLRMFAGAPKPVAHYYHSRLQSTLFMLHRSVPQRRPESGLFLQLIADELEDIPILGVSYSFGAFMHTQALGDLEALRKQGRRVARLHLGSNISRGLAALKKALGSDFM